MEPTTAVILAGGALDAEWGAQSGARSRAEVIVNGAPMYQHVVRALRGVAGIEAILLIGDAPAGVGYTVLPPRDSLLENARLGLEQSRTDSVLFATVDLPFLTCESVQFFLGESLRSGAALTYAVVPADLCRERFPQLRRTTVRLREGEVTGGNLFWARRAVALRELPRLEALYRARKQPARLALHIGLGLLLRFLLAQYLSPRWLSIQQIEQRVEQILHVPVKAILTPYPEVGADIDRLEHWRAVQSGGAP
ncbi:MAG: NTP transferase domain-containing protein [Fimbriimonadales bacterium]|nr:NTP transferase domain-containing protein [Fimbriimonadales bacterium]